PLPGDAAVPPDGGRGPAPAPRLGALRHRPRGVPPPAHEPRGAAGGLRLVLPAPVLPRLDLAPAARGPAGGAPLPGHVLPLQAQQPALAPADPGPPDPRGVAPAGGGHPPPAPGLPRAAGRPARRPGPGAAARGEPGQRRRVARTGRRARRAPRG